MRRRLAGLALGAAVGAAAVSGGREAAAQTVGAGAWSTEAEVGIEWSDQETRTGEGTIDLTRTRFEERLRVRNTGFFLVDRKLVTGSAEGRFGLFQEADLAEGERRSRDGTLLGYSFDAALLPMKPYTMSLFANRDETVISREFGGRSEVTSESQGLTFRLREGNALGEVFPYFSGLLGVRRQRVREETSILGQQLSRDEAQTVVTAEANKGFSRADLGLRYELVDVDERSAGGHDFQTHQGSLTFSIDLGPRRTYRWDTRATYLDRGGMIPSRFFVVDETLRIDHAADLLSEYRYLFQRTETAASDSTTHSASALLRHDLYRSLTTRLTGGGSMQDFTTGEREGYFADLDLAYRRNLPSGTRIFGGAGVRYSLDDNRFDLPLVTAVNEPHVTPTPLGFGAGFLLDNPLVVPSTIVVVTANGQATAAGVDYDIVPEGDRIRIVPIPTSLVIQPGQTLLVTYSFEVAPDFRSGTTIWSLNAGVDYGVFAIQASHRQSDEDLLGGEDGKFLDDRTEDSVRADARGEWGRVSGSGSAEYRVEDGAELEYQRWQFTEFFTYRAMLDLMLSLGAQQELTDYRKPDRWSESYNVRGTADWFPLAGLTLTGFGTVRVLDDSGLPTEMTREAGVRGRWTIGRLDVTPVLTFIDRRRGDTETTEVRAEVRLVRRFF